MQYQRFTFLFLVFLSLTGISNIQAESVKLAWDKSPESNVSGYNVYRSTTSGSGHSKVNGGRVITTTYTDNSVEAGRTYFYVVTAVNNQNMESGNSNEVQVVIPAAVNHSPSAEAGSDQHVNSGQAVTLSGSASDPDGNSLSYQWSQTSGTPVNIQNGTSLKPTFVAPQVSQDTSLIFRLTVTDSRGASDSDSMTVYVAAAQPSGGAAQPAPDEEEAAKPAAPAGFTFPASLQTGNPFFKDTYIGVAIVNPNVAANQVDLSALDKWGTGMKSVPLSDVLAAHGQTSFLADQLLRPVDNLTSVVAQGNQGPIQGFFMVGDHSLSRLDGIGGALKKSTELYFQVARHRKGETTFLHLFNPSETKEANLTLRLFDRDGVLKKQISATLAASGTLRGSLDQIFGSGLSIQEGYMIASANTQISGFQFCAQDNQFSALPGMPRTPVDRFFVPHFFVDQNGGDTQIRLLNPGSGAISVEVKALDDSSNNLGVTTVTLEPRQLFLGSIRQLLNLSGSVSGHLLLEVESDVFGYAAALFGSVSYSGNQGQFAASLPMIQTGQTKTHFLHVAQSEEIGFYTGLAILNPGSQSASVTVEAFDEQGRSTILKSFSLSAGKRRVGLLAGPEFFGANFEQVKGHIRVTSNAPVMTYALFGDYQQRLLSVIEGQQ